MNLDLLVGLAMLVGLVGVVIPLLPGLPIIMASAVLWAAVSGSGAGGWVVAAIVIVIAVAGMVAGTVLPARRAAVGGATWWVLAMGAAGLVVGAIVIPVVGALVGWQVGIFAAEWLRTRQLTSAWRTTRSTLVGQGLGIAVQLAAGVSAVAVWATAAWRW
jgi:uncharacterized protein YqgC (DUF456 family)